jgi:hypothetical protein
LRYLEASATVQLNILREEGIESTKQDRQGSGGTSMRRRRELLGCQAGQKVPVGRRLRPILP